MVKTSVLMTVHDREPEVLLATLRSLSRTGTIYAQVDSMRARVENDQPTLADCELVIVNDRSGMDYSWIKEYAAPRFDTVKWVDTGDYEGFRVDGYGNPAHAFNAGLELCTGDRLVVMSSDVIVTPKAVWSMNRFWDMDCLYTPRVMDLDSATEYCGATRPFPMPWFLAMPTKVAQEVGGWDENFLGGLCYEDNDFVARVFKRLGIVRCDWEASVYHQSHLQPAYDIKSDEVKAANARNRDICRAKWKGIPFDGDLPPFTIMRRPDPKGCVRLEVEKDAVAV